MTRTTAPAPVTLGRHDLDQQASEAAIWAVNAAMESGHDELALELAERYILG